METIPSLNNYITEVESWDEQNYLMVSPVTNALTQFPVWLSSPGLRSTGFNHYPAGTYIADKKYRRAS